MNRLKIITVILFVGLVIGSTTFGRELHNAPTKLPVNTKMMTNFLKSLIIPGWGQWSNGNKVRAVAYLAAEVASIYGYQENYSTGKDGERDFKNFANEHWYYGRWSPNNDGETACGNNLRTHQMPTLTDIYGNDIYDDLGFLIPLKDHHFYENISKYPEFVCGWDDIADQWSEDEKIYTPNKLTYIKMRTLSNDHYRNAQVAGTLIMINHLVSAFDAALGTDITSFETTNFTGKFYINPMNAVNGIRLEVKF
ncbi:hypothetical protein HQ531_09750 [bacterium]|nr:hypothetical protein [bacterium]